MRLFVPAGSPIRQGLTQEQRWSGQDRGLIWCWEMGRTMAVDHPEVASKAKMGHLIPLIWKGGCDRKLKGEKYGSMSYLAMWMGLRGDHLDLDLSVERPVTCVQTGTVVVFTSDSSKFEEP